MDHYRWDFEGKHYRRGYRQLMDNKEIQFEDLSQPAPANPTPASRAARRLSNPQFYSYLGLPTPSQSAILSTFQIQEARTAAATADPSNTLRTSARFLLSETKG